MTYCVGIRLNAGLVFLSDSRTNAGLDQISTFRKMMIYEKPGDRFMVMLSAGNLSISQSVREILQVEKLDNGDDEPLTIWNATSMFDATRVLGSAVRRVYQQDGPSLKASGIDFNASMIFGGQIKGEAMRLFLVYSAGNFIEATRETCFFQVGESKYGKPILDRVLTPATPLDEAAKCALVSMDSTLKSNLSVGLPLDLLVYREGSFKRRACLHRRAQPVLPDDPQHLGPAPARGVRGHRRPALGRRRHHAPADGRAASASSRCARSRHPGERIV
jgi:putative proteasome-type protease